MESYTIHTLPYRLSMWRTWILSGTWSTWRLGSRTRRTPGRIAPEWRTQPRHRDHSREESFRNREELPKRRCSPVRRLGSGLYAGAMAHLAAGARPCRRGGHRGGRPGRPPCLPFRPACCDCLLSEGPSACLATTNLQSIIEHLLVLNMIIIYSQMRFTISSEFIRISMHQSGQTALVSDIFI